MKVYDVAIVGAGPAGATCAWYLAQHDLEVLLLEKATFPRDKFCGDAVIPRAQRHLARMGVLDEMLKAGECVFTTSGGWTRGSHVRHRAQARSSSKVRPSTRSCSTTPPKRGLPR